MKKIIISAIAIVLPTVVLTFTLSSCGDGEIDMSNATKISFKESASFKYLKSLDGKAVTINGYLATSSPVDGEFIFLMNLPFQSCPFCVPNTSQLSNTMEVYAKSGEKFAYTDSAVKVVGKLVVADNETDYFTDRFGYQFNCKIVDATYTILTSDDIMDEADKEQITEWQSFVSTNAINDIYSMYDYLNFVCNWPEYFVNSYDDGKGNVTPGYYLWPADALNYLEKDKAQWNYGYKDGYFDELIKRVDKFEGEAFKTLSKNIMAAKDLASRAIDDLKNGRYTYEEKYVEKFNNVDKVFTLDNKDALMGEWEKLFKEFSDWFGSFEM